MLKFRFNKYMTVSKYGPLELLKKKEGGILNNWKSKYVHENVQWVVLCVHNKQIPLLEWYPTPEEIKSHQPLKVLDLLECLSVKISDKDDRHFEISFVDEKRPSIEFAARSAEASREWVEHIKKCLYKLNCLEESPKTDEAPEQQQ